MKIGLSLIMKNEEQVLPRLLNTIYPILDFYVVIDTGSSDNSKQVVKDFFDSKNITGEIYDHQFVDFENARNYALEKIKGKCEFAFWIDCDEELIIDKDFDLANLKKELSKHDIGLVTTHYNNSKYGRMNFFNLLKPFKWVGKVHEYLTCGQPTSVIEIKNLHVLVHPDGASWSNQKEKYEGHAKIFEREVKIKNDPRDVFYLAQSYKDAGNNEKALEWYKVRAAREDGFFEERYVSQLNIANLMAKLESPSEVVLAEWIKCSLFDNLRVEHLINIIGEYQNQGNWEASYIFSKYAFEKFYNKNPYPNRILFIDYAAYSSTLFNLHKVNCIITNRIKELKIEVDVCIISNAKTSELKKVTETGIKSLLDSDENIKFNVFVVESCSWVKYNLPNTITLYTDKPFGYNSYLNFARKQGKAPYVVLCNNDLTYEKGWATEIIKAMNYSYLNHGHLLSASPLCPQINHGVDKNFNIHFGYTVRRELTGWCIFQQRSIYDIIGSLDESVDFWYSDNIYSDQLIHHNVKHALVVNSVVNHHEKNLGITGESILDFDKKTEYTSGQYEKYIKAKKKYERVNTPI